MTKDKLEKLLNPDNIAELLDRTDVVVSDPFAPDYQKTAYNVLVEYLEHKEWFQSREGGLLILLSLEVLHSL